MDKWEILNWAFLLVPLGLGVLAVRLGAIQVREFHRHTGDTGVIMSMTGLSRFHDEPATTESAPELPMQLPKMRKSTKPLATVD